MKKTFILLLMHKWGLCKPFHLKHDIKEEYRTRKKGWCPVVYEAYQSFFYGEQRSAL